MLLTIDKAVLKNFEAVMTIKDVIPVLDGKSYKMNPIF